MIRNSRDNEIFCISKVLVIVKLVMNHDLWNLEYISISDIDIEKQQHHPSHMDLVFIFNSVNTASQLIISKLRPWSLHPIYTVPKKNNLHKKTK